MLICLYICCTTRAVHLELVPDLNTTTFIRSFKRFSSRRGIPSLVVFDNGKTFKSGAKIIQGVFSDPVVKEHFANLQVSWNFNMEKAPWWGGFFERLIVCTKRCLKKTIGRANLTFDELRTVITEVEAVVNSRPLTFIHADDLEELLTPSHLILGFRVLSLPDPFLPDDLDPDYNQTHACASRRMRYAMTSCQHFWQRWRMEYRQELREFHRRCSPSISRGSSIRMWEGQVVTACIRKGYPQAALETRAD